MYLFDEDEPRRVEIVEYEAIALADRKVAWYIICTNHSFTKFIEMIDADRDGDEEAVNYLTNYELHECIKASRDIQNSKSSYKSEVRGASLRAD